MPRRGPLNLHQIRHKVESSKLRDKKVNDLFLALSFELYAHGRKSGVFFDN
jgi:hypothetical protein